MRKIILGSVTLGLLSLAIVGCKKNQVGGPRPTVITDSESFTLKSTGQIALSTDGNVLIFNTVADYENAMDIDPSSTESDIVSQKESLAKAISGLQYPKFRNSSEYTNQVNSGKAENYPDFVLDILNKDGVVQIGDHLFRLDFIAQKGYSIPVQFKGTDYNKLVAGQNGNSNVTKYPWNKEMIYEAHNDVAKSGCSENQAPEKDDTKNYTDLLSWNFLLNGNLFTGQANAAIVNNNFDGELKAKYRLTPIGWDLYSKVILRRKTGTLSGNTGGGVSFEFNWSTAPIPVKLEWQRRYKRKCKPDTGYNSYVNQGTGIALGQSWQGIRACHKFILGANAYANVGTVATPNWQLLQFGTPSLNVNGTLYQVRISHGY